MPSARVNIYEAKTQLSRLVDRAAGGEEIIISRNGTPVARLSQLDARSPGITFGTLRGRIEVSADFDALLPDDVLATFEKL
jgi:antitoxin (DNA-binding transcriptional repressor) of toxin-antitoxin stability system